MKKAILIIASVVSIGLVATAWPDGATNRIDEPDAQTGTTTTLKVPGTSAQPASQEGQDRNELDGGIEQEVTQQPGVSEMPFAPAGQETADQPATPPQEPQEEPEPTPEPPTVVSREVVYEPTGTGSENVYCDTHWSDGTTTRKRLGQRTGNSIVFLCSH